MKKILLILLLFITGCSNYTDLKDLSIIKSIGIKHQDDYILYAQIYDEIKKNSNQKTIVIEANGKTMEEVFNNLESLSNKKIFLSHIDLLILDTRLQDNNYQDIINYFLNNNNFRNDFLCVFSDNIFEVLNNSKYDEVENIIKNNPNTINKSFNKIINDYYNNKSFKLSKINYDNIISFIDNYRFLNNNIERINNEK